MGRMIVASYAPSAWVSLSRATLVGIVTIEWDGPLHRYGRGGATGTPRRRSTSEILSVALVAEVVTE